MRFLRSIKLLAATSLLFSCSVQSPELIPCMCDDLDSSLGIFNCMCEPATKKPVKRLSYIQDEVPVYESIDVSETEKDAYLYLHRKRSNFASVKLEYVDFRIKKGKKYDQFDTKLGSYRFRIFGCRREAKNVFLNQGRAMQKDMRFFDIFFENMNDYYPVVVDKKNPNWITSDKIQYPEYILTAEITDYYMNICDEFDWNNVKKKEQRTGSSEVSITWRLMDLTKEKVYCKVTTTGYGEIKDGEYNGETLLVERAFEDALTKLPNADCFNSQLAQRVEIRQLKRQVVKVKKQQPIFQTQYAPELKAIEILQSCSSNALEKTTVSTSTGETKTIATLIEETGDVTSKGSAEVVETLTLDSFSGISEDGANSSKAQKTDETGGVKSSGSSYEYDDISENGASTSSGSSTEEDGGASSKGLTLDGKCSGIEVVDDGCTKISNKEEKVKIGDDYWIDVPLDGNATAEDVKKRNAAESLMAKNSFCIANTPPYSKMSPENLYRVRGSVVQVSNSKGGKGAGLIVSKNLVLTSADLLIKKDNTFNITTINGIGYKARAFRVNPNKNVAMLLLEEDTSYAPLPLSLELPEVNKDTFMTLGLLDQSEGEGYLDNQGRVTGYRYSEEKGAEIIVDTFVQNYTLGGALIDQKGNIIGIAHSGKKLDDNPDLFIPIETALRGLGVEICGVSSKKSKMPVALKAITKPISTAIEQNSKYSKDPKAMSNKEKK